MRQPYGRALASTAVYAHPAWYAAHGYLVVIQDVRGCGDSEGVFRLFVNEARDGSETLAWLKRQPDCNGKVGCYGFSYQGLSQLLWQGPDVPLCTAPAMAGLDLQQHWCQDGAAQWWSLGLAWALQLAAARCKRSHDGASFTRIRRTLDSGTFVDDGWSLLQDVDPNNHLLHWWSRNNATVTWPDRGLEAVLQKPMLIIGGWYDPYLRGSLDLQRRSLRAGGTPQLVVGPWTHLDWHDGKVDRQQLAFFDRYLKEGPAAERRHGDTESGNRVQLFDPGRRQWWRGAGWPATEPHAWCLLGHGLSGVDAEAGRLLPMSQVRTRSPAAGGWDRLVFDPWRATPARGGHLDLQAGPVDRTGLDRRSDVLTFTSSPLKQPLPLCGAASLRLRAASEGHGFDLCCTLGLLHGDDPCSRVEQLSMGVNRWLGAEARCRAWREVWFQPLLYTLPAGQRLRLSIALGGWPLIGINPGDGRSAHHVADHERQVVVVTFDWDEACFTLPLVQPAQAKGSPSQVVEQSRLGSRP